MNEMIIPIATAIIGSLGFGINMKIKMPHVIYVAISGGITYYIYLMAFAAWENNFLANFVAAVFVSVFAETMARIHKTPTTIFLTSGAICLIPGGRLYYAMYGIINNDEVAFIENGEIALIIALAIASGFMVVTVLMKLLSRVIEPQKRRFRQRKMAHGHESNVHCLDSTDVKTEVKVDNGCNDNR
ncbi:MAG: threonine/serine exporter family protein [Clostridiales bacterium]|nr:threonine/serine exporter family protein [Clostridiales bacterium]MDD7347253.1 threonine/serine exporter family protein [Clostridiales bacterium]MDY4060065.1 threonine/serine exporter family protein [Anaerovoracaceae bacterium]